MTQEPVAGWYADPERVGWLRWWDGEAWTADIRPDPNSAAMPGVIHASVPSGRPSRSLHVWRYPRGGQVVRAAILAIGIALGIWAIFDVSVATPWEVFSFFSECSERRGCSAEHQLAFAIDASLPWIAVAIGIGMRFFRVHRAVFVGLSLLMATGVYLGFDLNSPRLRIDRVDRAWDVGVRYWPVSLATAAVAAALVVLVVARPDWLRPANCDRRTTADLRHKWVSTPLPLKVAAVGLVLIAIGMKWATLAHRGLTDELSISRHLMGGDFLPNARDVAQILLPTFCFMSALSIAAARRSIAVATTSLSLFAGYLILAFLIYPDDRALAVGYSLDLLDGPLYFRYAGAMALALLSVATAGSVVIKYRTSASGRSPTRR